MPTRSGPKARHVLAKRFARSCADSDRHGPAPSLRNRSFTKTLYDRLTLKKIIENVFQMMTRSSHQRALLDVLDVVLDPLLEVGAARGGCA